ncbi:MAG: DUF6090 family protein [Cryomorphaceae bacterium]
MIKFFRHIRQNLIMENKTFKYFKYAIGEIVLVVIGILIALQINTWNSARVDNQRARDYTEKLKVQLNGNTLTVDDEIVKIESWYKTTLRLLPIIGMDTKVDMDDKIDSLILANCHDYHLNLDMNTITEGRENGNMTLISSDSIRQCIYQVATVNERVKERERITNEDLNTLFTPYLNRNYNYRNLVSKRYADQRIGVSKTYLGDNYKMLKDQEFENYIASRMEYNVGMLREYRDIRTVLKKAVEML